MLCQNCGKYEATTHVKRIINGEAAEAHLCPSCAHALGYDDVFGGFGNTFSELLGGFFGEPASAGLRSHSIRCEKCGNTFNDIVNSGKLGCADCYKTFYDKLLPSFQRIHGKTRHEGKKPIIFDGKESKENKLQKLEADLKAAVERQDFERAAEIRDEIKNMKGDGQNE